MNGDEGLGAGLILVGAIVAVQGLVLMFETGLGGPGVAILLPIVVLVRAPFVSAKLSSEDRENFWFVVLMGFVLSEVGAIVLFAASIHGGTPLWLSGLIAALGGGMAVWGGILRD